VRTGRKIVGYYGYIAHWMDFPLIMQAAKDRPDYEFVFIGQAVVELDSFSALPNVRFLGVKKYEELADYAARFDAAIIPFVIDETMECVSPIKFYEYCALGLPVVASWMPELEPYEGESIFLYRESSEFLRLLDRAVGQDAGLIAREKGPEIAARNTWDMRAGQAQEKLENKKEGKSD